METLTSAPVCGLEASCPKCGGGCGPDGACLSCGLEGTVDKRRLPAWSPATWESGVRRSKAGVVALSALVLDVDSGATPEEVSAEWSVWRHLVHTSWSHSASSPKFRVVVPFARPVQASRWPGVWRWAASRCLAADRACSDASRMYFLPARRNVAAEFRAWSVRGDRVLGPDEIVAPPPTRPPAPTWRSRRTRARPHRLRELARERLRTDPAVRIGAGERLGGRVLGEGSSRRVKGVMCPACGRASVWWPVHPYRMFGWACDHRRSCGARGWLDELLDGAA